MTCACGKPKPTRSLTCAECTRLMRYNRKVEQMIERRYQQARAEINALRRAA